MNGSDANCERWHEAIGALLDNEISPLDPALVEAHLERCSECRQYEEFAHNLRRAQLHPAIPQPDLTRRVVKIARMLDRAASWSLARAALAVCAIDVIAFSVPDLLGHDGGANTHSARHLGAFSIAFGVALLVVVVRPSRARSMLPVAMVLGAALAISATVDLIGGRAPLISEAQHLPELLSVVLLWLLAMPSRQHRPAMSRTPQRPTLRIVDRLEDSA